jgi:hypothetical protein
LIQLKLCSVTTNIRENHDRHEFCTSYKGSKYRREKQRLGENRLNYPLVQDMHGRKEALKLQEGQHENKNK